MNRRDDKVMAEFNHRNGLGCWINDIKNKAMANQQWPDVKIYEETVDDYIGLFNFLQKFGYNEITIWGLITSHDWPVDITSALEEERKNSLDKIIREAHKKGIKIIYGLGVYNWGFNEIISHDPEVRGSNKHALCGAKNKSMEWQKKIIDFIVSNLEIDGFHLQSADEGRCRCSLCSKKSDIEYFSGLDKRAAKYIKNKWSDKIIDVYMCNYLPWGDYIRSNDFKYLYELGRHIDILTDPGHYGQYIRGKDRKSFVSNLECKFGTSGFWVYPPQRWDRLRWFIPYINRIGCSIEALYQDGGRSFEPVLGPLINPGTEMNTAFIGKKLLDVDRLNNDILKELINTIYKPTNPSTLKSLTNVFVNSEEAYFDNWSPSKIPWPISENNIEEAKKIRTKTPERIIINELMLEPLWGTLPGSPIYLTKNMKRVGRNNYKNKMQKILKDISKIEDEVADSKRVERIKISINNIIEDIDSI